MRKCKNILSTMKLSGNEMRKYSRINQTYHIPPEAQTNFTTLLV